MSRRRRRAVAVLVGTFAALALGSMAGCASDPVVQGRLHAGMDDAPEGRTLFWPTEPEVPRYAYAGTLTGEPNFRAGSDAGTRWSAFGRWLVGLDGSGRDPMVLQRPSAVTGDNAGRLFVSDASRQAVFVFDELAGALHVWAQATGSARFVSPAGLAAGAGRLFVADAELGLVAVLAPDGTPLPPLGRGDLQRPTGLALDAAAGELYVADTYAHRILVFGLDGALRRGFGRRGTGAGEFNYPSHLAWEAGRLYVTDTMNNRVQVLDAEGRPQQPALGRRGLLLGNFVRPKGVGVDGEGNVYVVESYFDTLLVFTPGGELLLPIGGTGTATGRFYLPSGVWIDGRNRVHVADMFNGRIVLFQFLGGG